MSTPTITILELRYLDAIINSPYQDDKSAEYVIGNPIWSFCPNDRLQIGRKAAGVASSLCKKGLAVADDWTDDPTIAITAEGWAAYQAHHVCEHCGAVCVERTMCMTHNGLERACCNACADTADAEGHMAAT